jgi:hypothetical protein
MNDRQRTDSRRKDPQKNDPQKRCPKPNCPDHRSLSLLLPDNPVGVGVVAAVVDGVAADASRPWLKLLPRQP